MRSKEDYENEVISAWTYSALQAMDEGPEEEYEVLRDIAFKIIDGIMKNGDPFPFSPDEYVGIYDVPEIVFELAENNEDLIRLNREIKSLDPEYQKLLHFIARDHDPQLIIESLEYADSTVFWEKRGNCLRLLTGRYDDLSEEMKSQIVKIFSRYEKIRDLFLENTDRMVNERNSLINRRKWIITGALAVIIPLILLAFFYPRLIQKDTEVLFNQAVEKAGMAMTIDSTALLEEMIIEAEEYSPESYWLLSLKALQEDNTAACRENLESLKATDRSMYRERGRYIFRRLKR